MDPGNQQVAPAVQEARVLVPLPFTQYTLKEHFYPAANLSIVT
jgi:hypothetical protein